MVEGTPIDLEKLRSIAVLGRGRTRDRVRDVRDDAGRVVGKAVTDELHNTVTTKDESQDVLIRAPFVRASIAQKEIRE